MSVFVGMEESTAALPSDVRVNQQSRIFFHVLSLASRERGGRKEGRKAGAGERDKRKMHAD
jgi:hypothetical protein